MATKREELHLMAEGKGCLGRADMDEPLFVLRAHDRIAPATVRDWAERARRLDVHRDKVAEAMDLAVRMEEWQAVHGFKQPD